MRLACLSLVVLASCANSESKPDSGLSQPDAAVSQADASAADANTAAPDAFEADAPAPGDTAALRDVIISEVNWFGNDGDASDQWIELHNTSGSDLNLNGWVIEGAGSSASPKLAITPGTVINAGGYLLLAKLQGPDTEGDRTSLTGVSAVQLGALELAGAGEALVLKDPADTLIDQTPAGSWAAGSDTHDLSMERRDDTTGGGYTDGSQAGAWYSWSSLDGSDTTHQDSSDSGTPGAANTDPDIFDHLTITVVPDPPRALTDATFTVTAYSSSDESVVITSYQGTLAMTASAGTLSGQTSATASSGVATMVVQNDTSGAAVVFTVTDSVYPTITGSLTRDVGTEGNNASPRDVVLNEINWFGNSSTSGDEWIELRNVSGGALNLAGWTIDNAGTGVASVTIDSGTVLADGAYLIIGELQGPDTDGNRSSLTGVANVQLQTLQLANDGEVLVLRDAAGTEVDRTPNGDWTAGRSDTDQSMERQDNLSGNGYTDGSVTGAWYTWNAIDGSDTTNPDTSDFGTPGAANTDPNAIVPPVSLPYTTGFEAANLKFANTGNGVYSTIPPAGTSARTGTGAASTDSITTGYTGRQVRSVDCITLNNDNDGVVLSGYAAASSDNGGTVLRARWLVLWYIDAGCATAHGTADGGAGESEALTPAGSYVEITDIVSPPTGATHMKVWFQVRDDGGIDDAWALDDVSVTQPAI